MNLKIIPESHADLLKEETKAFAFLSTVMADGSPQVTPVWFNTDGEYILINSARGRVKDRNMRKRPKVALAIQDPKNPYRYIQIMGTVVEITTEGAREHIDALNMKYRGTPKYTTGRPGEERVIYKIAPDRVTCMG